MNNLQILIRNTPATEYIHNKDTFIEGREGSEFTIRLKNPYIANRVKAVISVDGLSVLDGKPASDKSTGYILENNQSLDIKGWRINDSEVRKFVFSSIKGSYSAKTSNDTNNVGVIAVKYFLEKYPQAYAYPAKQTFVDPNYYPWNTMIYGSGSITNTGQNPVQNMGHSTINTNNILRNARRVDTTATASYNATQGMMTSYNATQDMVQPASFQETSLGTGMGDKEYSAVYKETFNAYEGAFHTFTIYYDTLEGLQRRGIDVKRINYRPNPFPGNPYCVEV
jgi:hypothetical protein